MLIDFAGQQHQYDVTTKKSPYSDDYGTLGGNSRKPRKERDDGKNLCSSARNSISSDRGSTGGVQHKKAQVRT